MIFLTDENISFRAARMLEHFDSDNRIRALEDHFPNGTKDPVWLAELGTWSPKPVVICGDGCILKNQAEAAALRDAALMFVYLAPGWTNLHWSVFA